MKLSPACRSGTSVFEGAEQGIIYPPGGVIHPQCFSTPPQRVPLLGGVNEWVNTACVLFYGIENLNSLLLAFLLFEIRVFHHQCVGLA